MTNRRGFFSRVCGGAGAAFASMSVVPAMAAPKSEPFIRPGDRVTIAGSVDEDGELLEWAAVMDDDGNLVLRPLL